MREETVGYVSVGKPLELGYTLTTTAVGGSVSNGISYIYGQQYCPSCGKPRYWSGGWYSIVPPDLCGCMWGFWPDWLETQRLLKQAQPVQNIVIKLEDAARAAWQCPRCQKVNAPHVDQCGCAP